MATTITAQKPVTLGEITDAMLSPARNAANNTGLPQTVRASRFFGPRYVGTDCLLTYSAAVLRSAPSDAAPGAEPMLTVLPECYLADRALYLLDVADGLAW